MGIFAIQNVACVMSQVANSSGRRNVDCVDRRFVLMTASQRVGCSLMHVPVTICCSSSHGDCISHFDLFFATNVRCLHSLVSSPVFSASRATCGGRYIFCRGTSSGSELSPADAASRPTGGIRSFQLRPIPFRGARYRVRSFIRELGLVFQCDRVGLELFGNICLLFVPLLCGTSPVVDNPYIS